MARLQASPPQAELAQVGKAVGTLLSVPTQPAARGVLSLLLSPIPSSVSWGAFVWREGPCLLVGMLEGGDDSGNRSLQNMCPGVGDAREEGKWAVTGDGEGRGPLQVAGQALPRRHREKPKH